MINSGLFILREGETSETAMKPGRFYFINKDATSGSLSHSDKSERIRIHSHVQLGRKSQVSQSPEDSKTDEPVVRKLSTSSAPPNSKKPQIYRWNSGRRPFTKNRRTKEDSNKLNSLAPTSSANSSESDPTASEANQSPSLAASLLLALPQGGSFPDPFDSSCVKIDAEVQRLLLYYLHHAHPNTYYTETHLNKNAKTLFRNDAQAIVNSSFDDEANMYTLLASMASRMRYLEKFDEQKDSSPWVSKAIAAIQKRINENAPMTERMLFNLFQLGSAEFFRWDIAATLVHLKAIDHLITHLGGFRSIHHSLTEMIILGDGYLAAELGQKPLFSTTKLDFDSEALTPRAGIAVMRNLLDGQRHIASDILAPDRRDIVPVELRWIVMDMAVCLGVLQDHTSERGLVSDGAPSDVLHWLHLRNLAIRHRLLALDLEDERSSALCLALLMWDFFVFTVAGRHRTAGVVAGRLRDGLEQMSEDAWGGHEKMYFWILSIGATSAAEGGELKDWFVEQAVGVLLLLEDTPQGSIASFESLCVLEAKFLFYESMQDRALRNFWKQISSLSDKSS